MPKNLGKILNGKDITTKEYVDEKDQQLNESKLEESDLSEFSNAEIQALWNKYIED